MPNDKGKVKVIIEQRVYRNRELAKWICDTFLTEPHREAAWKTAFHIAEMFPEIEPQIRGELIDEDIQEELPWA